MLDDLLSLPPGVGGGGGFLAHGTTGALIINYAIFGVPFFIIVV